MSYLNSSLFPMNLTGCFNVSYRITRTMVNHRIKIDSNSLFSSKLFITGYLKNIYEIMLLDAELHTDQLYKGRFLYKKKYIFSWKTLNILNMSKGINFAALSTSTELIFLSQNKEKINFRYFEDIVNCS
jgi:hypothetical protein